MRRSRRSPRSRCSPSTARGSCRTCEATPPRSREASAAHPVVPFALSVALLAVAGVGAAFASDWFVDALEPAIKSSASPGVRRPGDRRDRRQRGRERDGVVLAARASRPGDLGRQELRRPDRGVPVPRCSCSSRCSSRTTLTFPLAPVYVGALVLTAIALWQITGDGEATLFEGVALIAMYVVLGAFAFLQ